MGELFNDGYESFVFISIFNCVIYATLSNAKIFKAPVKNMNYEFGVMVG